MTVAVIGAGSWGTALALYLARRGDAVRLWSRGRELAETMRATRENPWYLPGITLPSRAEATSELARAVADAELVVFAVPSEFFGGVMEELAPMLPPAVPVVSATKGLDPRRHVRMTELIAELRPGSPVAALSGPTFAREVARATPTAAVIASPDDALADDLQRRLGSRVFRLYAHRDIAGVELGGALKNVIAIATGLADGLGLGENARAALVTRGLAEITRLGVALGASPLTFAGLAGLGDLVLTCTGSLSRNRGLGVAIASGKSFADVASSTRMIAEGARTVSSAVALAARCGVPMPISAEVGAVLFQGKPPADALAALLDREMRREDV